MARTQTPWRHRSAGRNLEPQRYVAAWPAGIIKIGSTWHGRQRWGTFIARGAEILDLAYYDNLRESHLSEAALFEALAKDYGTAFTTKGDAVPYLGGRGDGWTECLAIPQTDWAEVRRLTEVV